MSLVCEQITVSAQNGYSNSETIHTKANSTYANYAAVVYFNGTVNKERVLLSWALDKNQRVDQIVVERSKDCKNFVMAGLIFGTDQPDIADYLFYGKNKKVKSFYRLKIIHKDQTVYYSSMISPDPIPVTH